MLFDYKMKHTDPDEVKLSTMLFVLSLQAPLNTPVTEDVFSILTEKYRIPVPILPGKILSDSWMLI